jgi:transaldolase/glucose-6-phosphate isomerase
MIEEDGLSGMTSNPSIFEKAINGSSDYEDAINSHINSGQAPSSSDVFFNLAIEDIQSAADVFKSTYETTAGHDGYVSLEVSPTLAKDTEGTIKQAMELFQRVNRPNVMIKVPATVEGLPAVEKLISEGLNINVTLLFSVERYNQVVDAYIRGLENRLSRGLDITNIASVASFFISRVDTAVDKLLEQKISASGNTDPIKNLLGKTAIANAKLAYQDYKDIFLGARFDALQKAGAKAQRLLWGSTGTKNPAYSETLYIDELIGPNTVNTVPPATYAAFKEHGKVADTLEANIEEAQNTINTLTELDLNLKEITDQLEEQGVQLFADAFNSLLAAIDNKLAGSGQQASNA